MTFDITPIVEAVVAVVCAVVTCVLIPYIKSKTTTEQQKEINAWVKIAVSAAEQIYTGSDIGRFAAVVFGRFRSSCRKKANRIQDVRKEVFRG